MQVDLPSDDVTGEMPDPLRRTLLKTPLGLGVFGLGGLGFGSSKAAAQESICLPPMRQ